MMKKKHDQMHHKIDQLDKRKEAMRALAVDLAYLRKTKNELIVCYFITFKDENEKIRAQLNYLTNVDEIHIGIDALANTPQGIHVLKDKYSKLFERFETEKQREDALEKEYFKIEPHLTRIKKIKTEIEEVEKSKEE